MSKARPMTHPPNTKRPQGASSGLPLHRIVDGDGFERELADRSPQEEVLDDGAPLPRHAPMDLATEVAAHQSGGR